MDLLANKRPTKRAALLLLLCSLISACDNAPVVAKVDGTAITAQQLLDEASRRGLPARENVLNSVLDGLIDREAAVIKADQLDLMDDPQFQQDFRTLTLETLRKRYQQDWESQLSVTDEDVSTEYNNNQVAFTIPEKRRIALIAFAAGSERHTTLPIAEGSLKKLQASEKGDQRAQLFQSLAVRYSTHRASRYRGGDVGFVEQVQHGKSSPWPPAVMQAAFTLQEPGDISPLIEANDTLYVLQLLSQKDAYVQPLESVKENIRQRLTTARFDVLKARSKAQLREDIRVRTFPEIIARISNQNSTEERLLPPQGPTLN